LSNSIGLQYNSPEKLNFPVHFFRVRSLVELLIDRVSVTDEEVEIRYVIPTHARGETTRFCHLRLDYFIRFHNKCHSQEMGVKEIEAFLTFLAVQEQVSASTQNQTLAALLFLYRSVLNYTHVLNRGGRGVRSPLDL
jgi:hypothetical protein